MSEIQNFVCSVFRHIQWNAKNRTSKNGKTLKNEGFECPSLDVRLREETSEIGTLIGILEVELA